MAIPDRETVQQAWVDNRRLWCHVAFAIARDAEAVDEIVQIAFKKVLAAERRWTSEKESLNYFKKVVVHCAVDYLKERRLRRYRQRPLLVEPQIHECDPEILAIEREALRYRRSLISAILDSWTQLPLAQREALHEIVLHGVGLREFSRRHNLPVTTVRSRLVRGLDFLRDSLRKRGIFPVIVR